VLNQLVKRFVWYQSNCRKAQGSPIARDLSKEEREKEGLLISSRTGLKFCTLRDIVWRKVMMIL